MATPEAQSAGAMVYVATGSATRAASTPVATTVTTTSAVGRDVRSTLYVVPDVSLSATVTACVLVSTPATSVFTTRAEVAGTTALV